MTDAFSTACGTANGWKLIWYPKLRRHQLFHLPDDPDEMKDLALDPLQ